MTTTTSCPRDPDLKTESESEFKPESKPESAPASEPEPQPEPTPRPDAGANTRPGVKPESKSKPWMKITFHVAYTHASFRNAAVSVKFIRVFTMMQAFFRLCCVNLGNLHG